MKPLHLLAILALLAPPAVAAPAAPAPPAASPTVPAGTPAPSRSPAPTPASTAGTAKAAPSPGAVPVNELKTAGGLTLSVDLHDEYVAGFPLLVTFTVRNDTANPLPFPDLAGRPYLVRFNLQMFNRKWERYTTPPAVEPSDTWIIAPRGQRRVTLEIPSSAGVDPGDWQLGIDVLDPAGTVTVPPRPVRVAPAKLAGAAYSWESTIQQTYGAMIPWVHKAATGFDLYLLQLDPHSAAHAIGQFYLARLPTSVDPVLSRARPNDAGSRYLYWQTAPNTLGIARLDGTSLRARPRTVSVPYPKVELLGQGATDAKGGVIIPLWVPAPKGTSGAVRALCIDERGTQVLREVATVAARPTTVATTVDAGSNLMLALGHAAGVDLYRVDPTLPAQVGAHGARVMALTDGWAPAALGFDSLPERGDKPGGLALLSIVTQGAGSSATYRATWSDLSGKSLLQTPPLPWQAPGTVISLLPAGYGPFYVLTRDATGKLWYGAQGAAAKPVDGGTAGTLWPSVDSVQLRRLVDGHVFEDRPLGPLTP
jgi:hypothetical protein